MSRTDGKTKKEKRVGSGGKEGRKGWARRRSARERVGNGGKRVGRGRKKGERRVEKRRKGFPKRSGARKSVKEGRKNGAYKPVFGRGSSRRAGPIKSDPPGKMPICKKLPQIQQQQELIPQELPLPEPQEQPLPEPQKWIRIRAMMITHTISLSKRLQRQFIFRPPSRKIEGQEALQTTVCPSACRLPLFSTIVCRGERIDKSFYPA